MCISAVFKFVAFQVVHKEAPQIRTATRDMENVQKDLSYRLFSLLLTSTTWRAAHSIEAAVQIPTYSISRLRLVFDSLSCIANLEQPTLFPPTYVSNCLSKFLLPAATFF